MRDQIEAGGFGYVPEVSMTITLKQRIPAKNGGDKKGLGSVIIDVGKGRRDADSSRQGNPCLFSDVFKFSTAQVFPKLIAADLVYKVNVIKSVIVDVRDRNAGAMIVMHWLIVDAGVVDYVVYKSNSALLYLVGEVELVKHFEVVGGPLLPLRPRRK